VGQAGARAASPPRRKGAKAMGSEGGEVAAATVAQGAGAERQPGRARSRRGVWRCAVGRAEGADAVMLPVKFTWLSPACLCGVSPCFS